MKFYDHINARSCSARVSFYIGKYPCVVSDFDYFMQTSENVCNPMFQLVPGWSVATNLLYFRRLGNSYLD